MPGFWRMAISRVRSAVRLGRVDDDFQRELDSHLDLMTDENVRRGLSRDEALRQARVRLGGVTQLRERNRELHGLPFLESILQDVRFSVRVLRKSPGFTIPAVLTLALAIGANSVVFSAINSFILHPLNVPDSQSLYQIERGKDKEGAQSYPDYIDLRDRTHAFDGLAGADVGAVGVDTGNGPTRAWMNDVTGNYFDVLRLQPYLGRFFHASDEHGPNSVPYIVLGYSYWHTHFKDDRSVVGRVVQINKHPFTILGVAPPEFHGTLMFLHPDLYMPLVDQDAIYGNNNLEKRSHHWIFQVMGHLKPGVTVPQAVADLNTIGADLQKSYPGDDGNMTFALARPSLYGDYLGPAIQAFLAGLMLLSGLILLAACANLGGLFAARAADRSREVALRLAIGAGRLRILRQVFTEAILISLVGGVIGIWGSSFLLNWLSHWQPFPMWPIQVPVNADSTVYTMALLLSLASGFLFGAAPMRQVMRTDPYDIVKSGTRVTHEKRVTLRDVLLVAQIAICAVLVTSSMVAVRGLVRSLHGDFGIDPKNTMLVFNDLLVAGYNKGDEVAAMQKRMIEAAQAIPGVTSVALTDSPPMSSGFASASTSVFQDEVTDLRPSNSSLDAYVINVSPDYFRAAGTSLISGRDFSWHDDKNTPRAAVVNREFARRMFGSVSNAMGRYFKRKETGRIQIVGVAEDGKYGSLTEDPTPVMFLPLLQSPATGTSLVVRSNGDLQQLATVLRSKLRDLDPGLLVTTETWVQSMAPNRFGARMAAMSLGVLGVMAAMLAITGVFGMAAYSVSRRLRELGIRMALGAQSREVLQAALGRSLKLLAFGSAAGLILGLMASRVLAAIVYQATPRDPIVLAGVVGAMLLLGLLATWVPAQRALSIDPLVLLREE